MVNDPENPIQIIVGLANPGKEYARTRHNAGAWFVERLAADTGTALRFEAKYHGLHALVTLHGRSAHLLIPTTFMNLSGQAIRACMKYHKLPASALLVAHDDIDLQPGTVRLKFDGGDGGHNGLKDIIRQLNTKAFFRLRFGVGRPTSDTVDYVLNPPSKAEKQKIDAAIQSAEENLSLMMAGKIQHAMQALHTNREE